MAWQDGPTLGQGLAAKGHPALAQDLGHPMPRMRVDGQVQRGIHRFRSPTREGESGGRGGVDRSGVRWRTHRPPHLRGEARMDDLSVRS